jgi:hypothetical protein
MFKFEKGLKRKKGFEKEKKTPRPSSLPLLFPFWPTPVSPFSPAQ